MKGKTLLKKAEKELYEDEEKLALKIVKDSIKNIRSCEKTLKGLKNKHKELLDMDVDEIVEDDEYEW